MGVPTSICCVFDYVTSYAEHEICTRAKFKGQGQRLVLTYITGTCQLTINKTPTNTQTIATLVGIYVGMAIVGEPML
jgi:hypothetical protein